MPEPFVAPNDPVMGQIVVAVPEVLVSAPTGTRCGDLGQAIRSQFIATLSQSPNFLVVDRQSMIDIKREQDIAASGAMDPRDRPAIGKIAGARYLIKADVTEFSEEAVGDSKGTRVGGGSIFRTVSTILRYVPAVPAEANMAMDVASAVNPMAANAKQTVHGLVGIELRIVDVDTGSVVRATRAHASLTKEKVQRLLGIAGISANNAQFKESVLGQVTRSAVEDAVRQIHGVLREVALSAQARTAIAKVP
jgi:curli biogenesis system outer membrane secretion channel CsgG